MKRIAIFLSGRGSNFLAIAKQCQAGGNLQGLAQIALVFSNKEDAGGLEAARGMGLPTAWLSSQGLKRETYDQQVCKLLEPLKIDYIILAGYMRVLSDVLVQAYPQRIINIHPADTKQHQGLHGYQWAWEQGLKTTKITIHYVDKGLDTGEIITQKSVDLQGATTLEEVEQRGLAVEHQLYSDTLRRVFADN